jgi:hypothetical protein
LGQQCTEEQGGVDPAGQGKGELAGKRFSNLLDEDLGGKRLPDEGELLASRGLENLVRGIMTSVRIK